MSKLIKGQSEPAIAAFGFQTIRKSKVVVRTRPDRRQGANNGYGDADDPLFDAGLSFQERLMELERRAQEIEKEAYRNGYEQGEKDGFEYGRKEIEVLKGRAEEVIGEIGELPRRVFRDYRNWLIDAAVSIARSIVQRELETTQEVVAETVEAILDEAEEHSSLTLYLDPNDVELFQKRMDLAVSARSSKYYTIKTDPAVGRGGCRLESDVQLLDASLSTQLGNIERSFKENGPEYDNDAVG